MRPDGGAADDLDLALCAAIPACNLQAVPACAAVRQLLRQARQAAPEAARAADPRPALWRRLEQAGVQAQPSDDTEPVPDSVEQVDDGVAAVGDGDNATVGQPARDLEQSLPCPISQLLMTTPVLLRVPLGGREHGQERQRPDAPSPRDRWQQR